MNPAIYYHPEAYSTAGPKLMGRNAARSAVVFRGLVWLAKLGLLEVRA